MDSATYRIGAVLRNICRDLRASGVIQIDDDANEVFARAMREDSNLELDWLWAAVQQTETERRRYCLERALAINPHSQLANRELAELAARQAMPSRGRSYI
jgi:hypothetical protein